MDVDKISGMQQSYTLDFLCISTEPPSRALHGGFSAQRIFSYSTRLPVSSRKAFLEDFAVDISSTFQDGDHVVVLIDGNTDMRKSDLSICFTSLHLREIILERHGMKGPKTCKKADLEPYRWHKGFSWYYYAGWWIFWL
jgi:hypothetical protein